ncbi:MAG: sigma-70 family RNA polymerase sigma factor [Deltaproteobacteria bacterium]|nr:sigma-70 family RNA polymerase sigma factor [Deltaproteobacteria bacterium]
MSRETILNTLIEAEWPKLRRFFRTKVPDADVLDLVQNTMLAFVGGKLRDPQKARAYLWGIARLQVLKHYEKHRRGSEPFDSKIHTAMDLGPSISSRLDRRDKLVRGLQELPVEHQMAFELRYCEELSLEEVAVALGVSLATAKRYIAAAQAKLQDVFGSDPADMRVAYLRS